MMPKKELKNGNIRYFWRCAVLTEMSQFAAMNTVDFSVFSILDLLTPIILDYRNTCTSP